MILYHVTTPKKVQNYHATGAIRSPVRGFTTKIAALMWACKVGRTVILRIEAEDALCHKLPDHHNSEGEAWWIDSYVYLWKCVFSTKDA